MYPIRRRTAYRSQQRYFFDPPAGAAWEPVTLELSERSRVEWSGSGVRMIYHGDIPFGVGIEAALQLGWCRLVEEADGQPSG